MTDTTVAAKSFLGVPIKGDITQTETRAEQKPIEDLAPLFQAVLDDPVIQEFGWRQYTPYFNDGDACVFNVHEPWFRTTRDAEVDDTYELELSTYSAHPTLGLMRGEWQGSYPNRTFVESGYEGEHEATWRACYALKEAFGSGSYDDVLQSNFGDHATITVTRDGIDVEFYEHD